MRYSRKSWRKCHTTLQHLLMSNKQWEKQSYDVVNLLKESIDQDSPEINPDCGQEHMTWKHSLSVEKNLMQKKRENSFSRGGVFWNSRGRKEFIMDNSVCITFETLFGPNVTAKRRNYQKFWAWAKYENKLAEIVF